MKAEELLYSLDHVGEDLLAGAEQTVLARKHRPWAGAAAAAVLLIALGAGGFFLWKSLERGSAPAATGNDPSTVAVPNAEPDDPADLPLLTVGDSWTGQSRVRFDDPERSAAGSLAKRYGTLSSLPVYEREGGVTGDPAHRFTEEQLAQRLFRAADWMGILASDDLTPEYEETDDGTTQLSSYSSDTSQGTLTVWADGRILMLFDEAHAITSSVKVELSGDLSPAETERALRDARMEDCGEQLAERLGLGDCGFVTCDRWDPSSSAWTVFTIYPVRSDPAEQLVSRYFESVRLLTNDGWTLRGFELDRFPAEEGAEAPEGLRLVGKYGLRTAAQAETDVLNGSYLCEEPLDPDMLPVLLQAGNLVYLPDAGHDQLMPFYRFWVPSAAVLDGGAYVFWVPSAAVLDGGAYVALYVPALENAFLTDFPSNGTEEAGLEALLTAPARWHCAEGRSIWELVLRENGSFVYVSKDDYPNFQRELNGSWTLRGDRLFLLAPDREPAEYEIRTLDETALELVLRSERGLWGELHSRSFLAFPEMETELPELPEADEQSSNEILRLFASSQSCYSRALTSEYGRPKDADLGLLFRNDLPAADEPLSETELEALGRVLGEDFEPRRSDYRGLPAAEIDAVLDLLYGTSLEKLAALRGADAAALLGPDYTYLPDFDCYYFIPRSDNQLSPSVRDVMQLPEGLFLVRYRADSYSFDQGSWLLLLERREGVYKVLSNAEESAYFPLQTLALASADPGIPPVPAGPEPNPADGTELPTVVGLPDGKPGIQGPAGTVEALQYYHDCEDPVWADLNRDGMKELVYWYHGPTSGLFTIGLCVYGLEQGWPVLKDSVLYSLDWGQLRLSEEDGQIFLHYVRSQWDPATQTDVSQPEQKLPLTLEDGKLVLNGGKAPEGCELWGSANYTRFGRSFAALEREVKDSCLFRHWACLVWTEPAGDPKNPAEALCAAASSNGVTVTGYLCWKPQPDGTLFCAAKGLEAIEAPEDPAALVGLSMEELTERYGPAHFDMGSGMYIPCWFTKDRKLLVVHAADTVLSAELRDLTVPKD